MKGLIFGMIIVVLAFGGQYASAYTHSHPHGGSEGAVSHDHNPPQSGIAALYEYVYGSKFCRESWKPDCNNGLTGTPEERVAWHLSNRHSGDEVDAPEEVEEEIDVVLPLEKPVEKPVEKPTPVVPVVPPVVTPPVVTPPVVTEEHKAIQTGFSISTPKQSITFAPNVVTPQTVHQTAFVPLLPVVITEPVEPEPKKKRSLMLPPPKKNPYRCYPPRPNRKVEIHEVEYDEEHSTVLITFRNWDTQPVILNRYSVALFDKEGEKIHSTSIGRNRIRYRGNLYIGKRSRKQEYRDITFAVIQRKHLKSVYPKIKEKYSNIGSAFVMFHRHLFDKSWMDKEWTVKISCGEEVVFQYPPEVETEAPAAPSLIRKGILSTTWGNLKSGGH